MTGGVHEDAILSDNIGHLKHHGALPGLIGRINVIMFRLTSVALLVTAIALTIGVIIGNFGIDVLDDSC